MHSFILLEFNSVCITLNLHQMIVSRSFWQYNVCARRQAAENNGIAALQLHVKIGWELIFTLCLHKKCFPNLKCNE